ncbi:MAG: hypothetical protein H7Y89_12015 [Steroidobacteraceae bacterium]|nr:hypothetical protein [Steroidobacteraceae bacterium]
MRKFSIVALAMAGCGCVSGCDSTRANPGDLVTVESPSRHLVHAPGVSPIRSSTSSPAAFTARSDSYTEDFDADGIADTRTVQTWTYDSAGRRCTEVTEIDFDADGTIDSRSTATRSADAC